MRIVIQRVKRASVAVDGCTIGAIGEGLLLLVGVAPEDVETDMAKAVRKIADLRIFEDGEGKMNRSLREIGGAVLAVSQFTLFGDSRKGRRPSFVGAAPPAVAEPLFGRFVDAFRAEGIPIETGRFGAKMAVELVNAGPVTLIVEVAPASPGG
jgi:D-tyrosyl-tRNA(Tyr) deacylase